MKTLFITALQNLNMTGEFGRGIRIYNDIFLTNDRDVIRGLVDRQFELTVGKLESQAILDSRSIIYCIDELSVPFTNDADAIRYINNKLGLIQVYLTCLWILKDNSVNSDMGFSIHPYKTSTPRISSNSRAIMFSNAICRIEDTEFNGDELRFARDYLEKRFKKPPHETWEANGRRTIPIDTTRLDRVHYFIQGARSAADLGVKISLYITCFETLLCTEPNELVHKLSERLAFFINENPSDRLEIYKNVKRAYKIRSRTVHGDKLTPSLSSDAEDISTLCDGYLRSMLAKMLNDESLIKYFIGDNQELDDYMTKLIFGAT